MKIRIKQVYIPYWEWEDWINGMWRKLAKDQEAEFIQRAIEFTGDWVKYGESMERVINLWPRTMINSLSNPSINKRAFLGHCAVQMQINCPEYITRIAWRQLTEEQRVNADKIAQHHIDNWHEEQNKTIHRRMGKQMLLRWNS